MLAKAASELWGVNVIHPIALLDAHRAIRLLAIAVRAGSIGGLPVVAPLPSQLLACMELVTLSSCNECLCLPHSQSCQGSMLHVAVAVACSSAVTSARATPQLVAAWATGSSVNHIKAWRPCTSGAEIWSIGKTLPIQDRGPLPFPFSGSSPLAVTFITGSSSSEMELLDTWIPAA